MIPKRTRRRYTAEIKPEVVLTELTARYQLATAQITRWKLQLRQQVAQVFADALVAVAPAPDVGPLHTAISWLKTENTLLKKILGPCQ